MGLRELLYLVGGEDLSDVDGVGVLLGVRGHAALRLGQLLEALVQAHVHTA